MKKPTYFTDGLAYEQHLAQREEAVTQRERAIDNYPYFASRVAELARVRTAFEGEKAHFDSLRESTIADRRAAAAARKDAERLLAEAHTETTQMREAAHRVLAEAEAIKAEWAEKREKFVALEASLKG